MLSGNTLKQWKYYIIVWVSISFLAGCATSHQPKPFAPYFSLGPDNAFTSEHASERDFLEVKREKNLFEQKRLLELYQLEAKGLKPKTARGQELAVLIDGLKRNVSKLEEDVQWVRNELKSKVSDPQTEKPVPPFQNASLKKEFFETWQLWNRDQTDAAMQRLDEMERSYQGSATTVEKLKLANLRFRMLLEQGDAIGLAAVYERMKELDECDPDVTQAGFLTSLITFAGGNAPRAKEILKGQCDKDESPTNLLRRDYWTARFSEGTAESLALYESLSKVAIPSYTGLLAQIRRGQRVVVPVLPGEERAYLAKEVRVPSSVHEALLKAEERIDAGLRKDAMAYLTLASRLLRRSPDESWIDAMLYTAHVCKAAGAHLEAAKLYAEITNLVHDGLDALDFANHGFLQEMFPRPFAPTVEWTAKMWNVDADFVYSIIRQESAFNPLAVSTADARGLMQLMPSLGRTLAKQWNYSTYFGDKALYHAQENLKMGIFHLRQLYDLLPHPVLVAASYNAGIHRVMNWWKRYGNFPVDIFVELIPIHETRNYVKLVLRNYFFYKWLRQESPVDPAIVPFSLQSFPKEYATLLPPQ